MADAERTMTVDLRRDFIDTPLYKRAKKAVTSLRARIMSQTKATEVKIGKYLNLKLWERGMRNPAHKVTFVVTKNDKGVVTAELPNIPQKKQKEEKTKPPTEQAKAPEQKQATPDADTKKAPEAKKA